MCKVLESGDTGSDVFFFHYLFAIIWSFDESHDMMPSSPMVLVLLVIHTEVGPGVVPGSALACA